MSKVHLPGTLVAALYKPPQVRGSDHRARPIERNSPHIDPIIINYCGNNKCMEWQISLMF